MAWIKAFFSALVPTLPVTAVSTICAGIFCAINFALVGGVKSGLMGFMLMVMWPPASLAFIVPVMFSFYPNLIGVFLIFFSALLNNQWPMRLSKRGLYLYGGGYGIIICIIAVLLMMKKWTVNEVISSLLFSTLMFPAAVLSGIITFKLIIALRRYKFTADTAAKPSFTDPA